MRITAQGKSRHFISQAAELLGPEKGHSSVELKAMGRAINKAVTVGAWVCIGWWVLHRACCAHVSRRR